MKTQPLTPNKKIVRLLQRLSKDIHKGKNVAGPFYTAEEMIASLNSKGSKKRVQMFSKN